MSEMTSRERFQRMYQHKEADRVPMVGGPWGTTIERWRREAAVAKTRRNRPDLLERTSE